MRFSTQELRAVLADALRWPEVVAIAGPGETLGERKARRTESIVRFRSERCGEVDYLIDWSAEPDVDDGNPYRKGLGHFSRTVFCLTPLEWGPHFGPDKHQFMKPYGVDVAKRPDVSYICRGTVAFDSHNPSGLLWTLRRWHKVIVEQRGMIQGEAPLAVRYR